MKKVNKHKIFIFFTLILTLILLFIFFKNIFAEIIKYELNNDVDGMKKVLSDKGMFGGFLIVLVQAMQMVCVIISAEFIQTAAAISYPWYLAIILCDLGVMLGATIIFVLVRSLKFDTSIFKNQNKKIQNYSKHAKDTQLFMLLLYFMPILPFGAICYYGSSKQISYRRYILTCAVGCLPSILSSFAIGKAIEYIIQEQISIWILVIVLIFVVIFLFVIVSFIMKKTFKKTIKNTPDSKWYTVFFNIFKFKSKNKPIYDNNEDINIDGPFVLLSNHPSPYDVYYISRAINPIRPAFILNRYYFRNKTGKKLLYKIGAIPKKLFNPDIETIKKTLSTIHNDYPVYMAPEGRVGIDGTNYDITFETGKFIKRLNLPIVIFKINGGYIAKPSWRKHQVKCPIKLEISKFISVADIEKMTVEELNEIVREGIEYNDFEYLENKNIKIKDKHKALGLENLIYYCPKCKKEHCFSTYKNTIKCTNCSFELSLNEQYQFNDNEYNIKNIHDWYELIKKHEQENIQNSINLECNVKVLKFNFTDSSLNEEGNGICYLNNNEFKYSGDLKVKEFRHSIKDLKALPFTCGEEFSCYYENELYYFYPINNKSQSTKWSLIVDELQKVR